MRPHESRPAPAPVGLAGWLLVLLSTTSSMWSLNEPVWLAVPLAFAGTALVARQASTSTTSTSSRQEARR